jgi:transketolase
MVKQALEVRKLLRRQSLKIGVVDVYRIPADRDALRAIFDGSRVVISLEEHTLRGGLGSYLLEEANDMGASTQIRRLGMDTSNGYAGCYNYGGREAIRAEFGLDVDSVADYILNLAAPKGR